MSEALLDIFWIFFRTPTGALCSLDAQCLVSSEENPRLLAPLTSSPYPAFHFHSAAGSASPCSFLSLQHVKLIPMCSPIVRRPIITQVLHEGEVITEQSLCTLVGKGASFTAESEEVALLCLSTFVNRTK